MAQGIPLLTSEPWFRTTTPLDRIDGSQLVISFDFKWNLRDQSWYFDVFDDQNRPIVHSVRLVQGVYLGRRATHEFFRNGALVAISNVRGDDRDPGFDDLGRRISLVYLTVYDILLGRGVLPSVLL